MEFGDAELAALIAPRPLTLEASDKFLAGATDFNVEHARASRFYKGLSVEKRLMVAKRRVYQPRAPLAVKLDPGQAR